jgi:hypothetical protein
MPELLIKFLVHESGNGKTTLIQKKSESSPKNRISWPPWARFEKSDFSQKSDLLGAWARFEKSDFSQKISWALSGWSGNFRSPALAKLSTYQLN